MQQAGDYGGSNAQARQAALARRTTGAIGSGLGLNSGSSGGSVRVPKTSRLTASASGRYSRPVAPPPATPGPIDPNAWLGSDTGYQDQLRQFMKSLTDFQADVTRRRGIVDTDYGTSKKALADQRGLDLDSLETDFGSRGLLRSGLYGTAVGDYEKEYNQRLADLTSNKDRTLAQLLQEQNQFTSQQDLQKQAAREAALRRRAEQLGTVA